MFCFLIQRHYVSNDRRKISTLIGFHANFSLKLKDFSNNNILLLFKLTANWGYVPQVFSGHLVGYTLHLKWSDVFQFITYLLSTAVSPSNSFLFYFKDLWSFYEVRGYTHVLCLALTNWNNLRPNTFKTLSTFQLPLDACSKGLRAVLCSLSVSGGALIQPCIKSTIHVVYLERLNLNYPAGCVMFYAGLSSSFNKASKFQFFYSIPVILNVRLGWFANRWLCFPLFCDLGNNVFFHQDRKNRNQSQVYCQVHLQGICFRVLYGSANINNLRQIRCNSRSKI